MSRGFQTQLELCSLPRERLNRGGSMDGFEGACLFEGEGVAVV